MQRLRRAADLDGNRGNGRPLPRVLGRVLKHHPYGALTHLRRKLTGRLVIRHGSNLSTSGASDKPGAVQWFTATVSPKALNSPSSGCSPTHCQCIQVLKNTSA